MTKHPLIDLLHSLDDLITKLDLTSISRRHRAAIEAALFSLALAASKGLALDHRRTRYRVLDRANGSASQLAYFIDRAFRQKAITAGKHAEVTRVLQKLRLSLITEVTALSRELAALPRPNAKPRHERVPDVAPAPEPPLVSHEMAVFDEISGTTDEDRAFTQPPSSEPDDRGVGDLQGPPPPPLPPQAAGHGHAPANEATARS